MGRILTTRGQLNTPAGTQGTVVYGEGGRRGERERERDQIHYYLMAPNSEPEPTFDLTIEARCWLVLASSCVLVSCYPEHADVGSLLDVPDRDSGLRQSTLEAKAAAQVERHHSGPGHPRTQQNQGDGSAVRFFFYTFRNWYSYCTAVT